MDLGLSDDQLAIEAAFTSFFAKEAPPSVARAAEPLGFDRDLWERLCTTGAPGIGAAEEAGGGGAGLADQILVAEALGRHIAPVPLIEHMIAAAACTDGDVVTGDAIATIALRPAHAGGLWPLVPGGAVADVVIGIDGDKLVAVRSDPPGTGPRNHADAPIADRSARVGDRRILGPAVAFDRLLDEWKTLTSAALVGITAAALELAVSYVMSRQQFGVPVGSFQAVQQGLADIPALLDGSRLLVHKAAWAGDEPQNPVRCDVDDNDITDFSALASMAFVFSADAAAVATDRSLHYHGGYGYAKEYDIQLYFRRARGWALIYDDPSREAIRLADRFFGKAA